MATTKNRGWCKAWLTAGIIATVPSCAPKATVVEPTPVTKKVEKKAPEPTVTEELVPMLPEDDVRMSGMLDLPSDSDFRSTNPNLPKTGPNTGAFTSRPPTDPPARVKPKADEPE